MEMSSVPPGASFKKTFKSNIHFMLLAIVGWTVLFLSGAFGELYARSLFVLGASCLATLIVTQVGYFDKLRLVPRKSDAISVFFAVPSGALLAYLLLMPISRQPLGESYPFLLIASWSLLVSVLVFAGHHFLHWLVLHKGLKRRVVFDVPPAQRAALVDLLRQRGLDENIEYLGKEALGAAKASDIDLVVIAHETASNWKEDFLLLSAHLAGTPIIDHQQLANQLTGRINTDDTDPWRFLQHAKPQTPFMRAFLAFRTVAEPLCALLLALVLSPLMLLLSVLIKITSPGPVLYRQVRSGYLGRPFTLYKFRSMREDAETAGPQWAARNDPRVTPLGKLMRNTRLDELPQLWNVLKGDMSFIGPRPERPEIYEQLTGDLPFFPLRTLVKPGVTGWAQVCSGYAASVEESRTKLEHDLFYIQNLSPFFDLIILLKTAHVALTGDKAAKRPAHVSQAAVSS